MRGGRGRGVGRRRGCVKIGRGVVYCGIFLSGFVRRGYPEWSFLYCRVGYDLAMYSCMVMGCDKS